MALSHFPSHSIALPRRIDSHPGKATASGTPAKPLVYSSESAGGLAFDLRLSFPPITVSAIVVAKLMEDQIEIRPATGRCRTEPAFAELWDVKDQLHFILAPGLIT